MLRPTIFDLTAHYEPNANFQFSRRLRNDFDELARRYYQSTWMLGHYGGKARIQTDVQGIAVATRIEIGRLAFRTGVQRRIIQNAFELFQQAQTQGLASGRLDRILVRFSKAVSQAYERTCIQQAYGDVFEGNSCHFLGHEKDLLELGHCVVYQTLVQYLRENGLYHSAHRPRVEAIRRHLQQEIGRYENYLFFVRPEASSGPLPGLTFCYTGTAADVKLEAFLQEYTREQVVFIPPAEFRRQQDAFVSLEDYEQASRRFGGLWVLQKDLVRHLDNQQLRALYLFLDEALQPELERRFEWDELFARQQTSTYINRASRNSSIFLDTVLEKLEQTGFITEVKNRFQLAPGFQDFKHVAFYQLGEYQKRLPLEL